MNKVIYRLARREAERSFAYCYEYVVDRETDQMLYGVRYPQWRTDAFGERFAIQKQDVNKLQRLRANYNDWYYEVFLEADNWEDAKNKAEQMTDEYIKLLSHQGV